MLRPLFLLKLTLSLACAALLLADTSADAGRRRRRGCCDEQPTCCGTTSEAETAATADDEPAPAPTPVEEAPYEEADAPPPAATEEPDAPAPDADAADAENNVPPEGFTALFNGEDLTGWKGLVGTPITRAQMTPEELEAAQEVADERMRTHWSVQDGVLVFDGGGDSLCTVNDYANFEMLVDWKIEAGGDSGIYLRGSPQVQIWDTEHEPLFGAGADKGSGSLWNNQTHERFPKVKADKPVGEWNSFHIKMIGERVQVTLNGTLVFDDIMENYWERDKPIYPSGQIELQNHGNTLNFRNVYVKELPEDATFE